VAENPTRIDAMLRYESSPGVQPGCGSRLAWRRFREFSNRNRYAANRDGICISSW